MFYAESTSLVFKIQANHPTNKFLAIQRNFRFLKQLLNGKFQPLK